ncbi:MAG TPA: hypothetical protein VJK73_02110, partial [Candidatus Paceibacterota bacterium]
MASPKERMRERHYLAVGILFFGGALGYFLFYSDAFATVYDATAQKIEQAEQALVDPVWPARLDKDEYNRRA